MCRRGGSSFCRALLGAPRLLSRRSLRLRGGFANSKVLALLSLLDFGGHPSWHCPATRPSLRPVLRIAVLGSDLAALHLAPPGATDGLFSRRYPTAIAKGRELGLQLTSLTAQHRA